MIAKLLLFLLAIFPMGIQSGMLKLSSSGLAIGSLLHSKCTNIFFGLKHGDIRVRVKFE